MCGVERRHLGRQARLRADARRVPKGLWRERVWRVQHCPRCRQVRSLFSRSHVHRTRTNAGSGWSATNKARL